MKLKEQWYFVTKIVQTFCKKKIEQWYEHAWKIFIETKTVNQTFNVVTTVKKIVYWLSNRFMNAYTTASNGILLPKLF